MARDPSVLYIIIVLAISYCFYGKQLKVTTNVRYFSIFPLHGDQNIYVKCRPVIVLTSVKVTKARPFPSTFFTYEIRQTVTIIVQNICSRYIILDSKEHIVWLRDDLYCRNK